MPSSTETVVPALQAQVHDASFDRTIPRALVHKAGPEAVWLTELAHLGDDAYVGVGQVPRSHSYLDDRIGDSYSHCDLAFLVEIARQTGIAVTHHYLGVPVNHPTIFMKLGMEVTDPSPTAWTPAPAPAAVQLRVVGVEEREGVPESFAGELDFVIDGRHRARTTALWAAHEPAGYKAARAEGRQARPLDTPGTAPEPLAPERVGRRNPDNVVIGELERDGKVYGCGVVVDEQHPHFYEHPVDHIPGVLMLEAFRQAATAAAADAHGLTAAGAVVTRCDARFSDFAENELPLHCEAAVGEAEDEGDAMAVPVRLRLDQPGTPRAAQGNLTVRFPTAR
jgi:2-oxo-3-(phosphooxy)propyl 3-oxoalkanoate synthase